VYRKLASLGERINKAELLAAFPKHLGNLQQNVRQLCAIIAAPALSNWQISAQVPARAPRLPAQECAHLSEGEALVHTRPMRLVKAGSGTGSLASDKPSGHDGAQSGRSDTCVYRKLDSAITVMKAAEDRLRSDGAEALDRLMNWRVLLQSRCVLDSL
jgi:hypothetical protein